jgi:hypothetical protein
VKRLTHRAIQFSIKKPQRPSRELVTQLRARFASRTQMNVKRPLIVKKDGAVMRVSNSIAELRQQIHDELRIQHPEWIEPNGECPECDFYEARLMEELDTLTRRGSESIAAIHRAVKEGVNWIDAATLAKRDG